MPNHVVCLKHGKKYSAEYVNVLYRMVTRNLTVPHNFVCFTEDPTGLDMGIQVKPLQLMVGGIRQCSLIQTLVVTVLYYF